MHWGHTVPVLNEGAGTLGFHLLMLMLAMVGYSRPSSLLLLIALGRRWRLVSLNRLLRISLLHLLILRLLLCIVAALVWSRCGYGNTTKILLVAHAGELFDLDAVLDGLLLGLGESVV